MHILVKTLTGQSCAIDSTEESVSRLQSDIEMLVGVPSCEQKLIFNGKKLEVGKVLGDYGIVDNSNIYLVIELEGGAKGKKKKKDTKKGKKKHKKKKSKLQILKYYKVDDGKIVKLKNMCRTCPPGTFLAEHPDRLYCGRCHFTYAKTADTKQAAKGGDKGAAKPTEKGGKKK